MVISIYCGLEIKSLNTLCDRFSLVWCGLKETTALPLVEKSMLRTVHQILSLQSLWSLDRREQNS